MPTKASVIGLSAVLTITVGCDLFSSPGQTLSHAVAMTQCGPADEGFTRIVLAEEPIQSAQAPFPNVQVVIQRGPIELPGHTYSATSNDARAWYITGPGTSQEVAVGSVTIASVDSSNTVTGSVSLRFPMRFVQTEFTAPWISSGVFCN